MAAAGARVLPATSAAAWANRAARGTISVLFGAFVAVSLVAPGALLNKILYAALFFSLLLVISASRGCVKLRSISPLAVVLIVAYGYVLSFVFDADRQLANQLMLSVAILLLVYLIDWCALDIDKSIKASGVFLCVFTGGSLVALVVFAGTPLGTFMLNFFFEYSFGAFGQRTFFGTPVFNYRIGTAPFLFLPYCLFFASFADTRRLRDLSGLLLVGSVIVLSTSRGLILGCLIASVYLTIAKMRPATRAVAFCVGAVFAVLALDYLLGRSTVLSLSDVSNNIKLGHTVSFMEHMTPLRVLFGEGLASYYYTLGFRGYAPQTEITLLDTIRYVGLPLTGLLYVALMFPVRRPAAYAARNGLYVLVFALYLGISLTNPVLFNSYGLLVVVWYWSHLLRADAHLAADGPQIST